ncbi:uncharacterized protein LOC133173511 [Saccostrea echinata]|uniref:uncharacterized protein LOC133173511 n=1 Tax=Saccostrea echinata TaxID=191078 RepID=UPI002A811C09|nr:uncharacterized protein LOC133173511 [Saccostrea echinata]
MKTTLLFVCSLFCLPRRVFVFVPFHSRGNVWDLPSSDWSTGSLWPTPIGNEWTSSSFTDNGGLRTLREEPRSQVDFPHDEVCNYCHKLEKERHHGCGAKCYIFDTCSELQSCRNRLTENHRRRHQDFPYHLVCSFCQNLALKNGHSKNLCSMYCIDKFLYGGRLFTL